MIAVAVAIGVVVVLVIVVVVVVVVAVTSAAVTNAFCDRVIIHVFIRFQRHMVVSPGRAVARVHVVFDCPIVGLNVCNHAVLQRPFEKIQLANCGLNEGAIAIRNCYAVPPAERVEPALAISLQLQLVVHVHLESPIRAHFIHREKFLRKIRGKPVNDAERNWRLAINDLKHLLQIVVLLVKFHQIRHEQIVLRRVIRGHVISIQIRIECDYA